MTHKKEPFQVLSLCAFKVYEAPFGSCKPKDSGTRYRTKKYYTTKEWLKVTWRQPC